MKTLVTIAPRNPLLHGDWVVLTREVQGECSVEEAAKILAASWARDDLAMGFASWTVKDVLDVYTLTVEVVK